MLAAEAENGTQVNVKQENSKNQHVDSNVVDN